jgi:predicted component of type VI protein secretion system
MAGRISGLGTGSTRDKLAALEARISQDWQGMGFDPAQPQPAPVPMPDIFEGANSPFADPQFMPSQPAFGADTRAGLDAQGTQIDAETARTNALVDAILNAPAAPPAQPRNAPSGMGYTPDLPKPQPAAAVAPPKPRLRPKPEAYTIKAGDNPTKIAKAFGMSLKELEQKNPGILKKARRLKIGATVKV